MKRTREMQQPPIGYSLKRRTMSKERKSANCQPNTRSNSVHHHTMKNIKKSWIKPMEEDSQPSEQGRRYTAH
jgi:hypothetical protein